jgi:sulfate adenylyltransferase
MIRASAAFRPAFPVLGRQPAQGPSWKLGARQQCDLELIANGGFAPLRSFLGQADYESVCSRMRLVDGSLWPIPVVLDVPESVVRAASKHGVLILADQAGTELGSLTLTEAWRPDRLAEAEAVLGTTDRAHPWAAGLMDGTHPWYVTGELAVTRLPVHSDLPPLVHTPAQLKDEFRRRGWTRVVAFNTRNPMHEAHRALVIGAAEAENAYLLVHPVVGPTRAGDVPAAVRARCYQATLRTLGAGACLSLLPLAMRMAGPREALWHAIIRRNYGASAFIVGRDHAGPGLDSAGRSFYHRYAAQRLVTSYQAELGIRAVCAPELCYVDGLGYVSKDEVPPGRHGQQVSGTRLRQLLAHGREVPPWLALPEVVAELASFEQAG